jgi:cell division protein FtsI (penicillin-binding protein 3)
MEIQGTRRVHLLARLGLIWAALIAARLLQLQIVQHPKYRALARDQQEKTVEVRAPRGAILDRMGQRLALSLPVVSVCVNPLRLPDATMSANILANILDLDAKELLSRFQLAQSTSRGFLWVKRRITPDQAKRLTDLNFEWVEMRTESVRFYPNKQLAAHVLGGVDFEENGNAGVELALNPELEGHPGERRVTVDPRKQSFHSETSSEAIPGGTLKLTIDSRIQFAAERELEKAIKEHGAKNGSVVVMDPRTGDILAIANYPTFDPNEPPTQAQGLTSRDDLAVTTPYEPGSVFKVVTLTAALETTKLRPETVVPCGSTVTIAGRVIHDHGHFGSLPMEDVLARSSNTGAINIGIRVGDAKMYEYMKRFGLGRATGITLPGESSGLVRPLRHWSKVSIGSVAMGHEVSVTTLQLAQICSVIASGGFLVRPRLVANAVTEPPQQVIRPETAITMRSMMEGVVIKPYGTGHRYAHIPGYTSAGKTGTAQTVDPKTGKYKSEYNASFMGFSPVTNPAVVVAVTLHGTHGEAGFGGPVSAPVFREVAAVALRILNVPKDLPDDSPDKDSPAQSGSKADENDLSIAVVSPSVPQPLAGTDQAEQSADAAPDQRNFSLPAGQLSGPTVPNFRGKSVRDVLQESAALGIPLEYIGSGVARTQIPPAGAFLPIGERVRVQFGH